MDAGDLAERLHAARPASPPSAAARDPGDTLSNEDREPHPSAMPRAAPGRLPGGRHSGGRGGARDAVTVAVAIGAGVPLRG
ncbi:hypothetical protein D3272_04535 [Lichenibacterium ramalinae]|uniref:Uncharacterized protein n=1 Tax=Lichenibacterium ramalinae TaxID=2316527 RepID=A0A4Q2RJK1_9HYPH|nr:hypothetical protein D3272_04535 [Lichenibacterium ramalinae]